MRRIAVVFSGYRVGSSGRRSRIGHRALTRIGADGYKCASGTTECAA